MKPFIDDLLERHARQRHNLVQLLREVQEHHGWLPPQALEALGTALDMPPAAVAAVASFYSFFNLESRGEYRLLFADNIIEQMQGSRALLDQLCRELLIEPGQTSEDGLVSVDLTSCIGMGDQGVSALINQRPLTGLTPQRIDEIASLIRNRVPLPRWPQEYFLVESNVLRRGLLLDDPAAPGDALRAALDREPGWMLDELQTSGLRGRGGAGFPTAGKWRACRDARGDAVVVCNADEGEPGTFKDRVLLTRHADAVFEGMTLCARSVGAQQGFLYLRGEYRYLLESLQDVLQRRRDAGLLGRAILGCTGFDFDIAIHIGMGAYVCGEESALIESLEGKRGTPRNRPPFPVTHGYLGRPTVVNNVETFAAANWIARHGGAAWAAVGTGSSSGSKLLSVSGDCARPGIYEYPFGVTVRQVLLDCGAEDALAVQVGGPSGVCVAAEEFERRIAFEDVSCAGAFMVFGPQRDPFEMARNFTRFFAHESCGFCTPCRVGTSLLSRLMDKLHCGNGSPQDLAGIESLNGLLQRTSHCGLGHSACNPVLDTLRHFPESYRKRMMHSDFTPAFNLDAALSQARRMTGRNDPSAHLISGCED